MSIIETLDTAGFTEYLKKYGNTICGRHPIGVLLNVNIYFYLFKIMFLLEFFVKHLRWWTTSVRLWTASKCRSNSWITLNRVSAALLVTRPSAMPPLHLSLNEDGKNSKFNFLPSLFLKIFFFDWWADLKWHEESLLDFVVSKYADFSLNMRVGVRNIGKDE